LDVSPSTSWRGNQGCFVFWRPAVDFLQVFLDFLSDFHGDLPFLLSEPIDACGPTKGHVDRQAITTIRGVRTMLTSFRKMMFAAAVSCAALGIQTIGLGPVAAADGSGFSSSTNGVSLARAYDDVWEVRYRLGANDPWQMERFEGDGAEERALTFCERLRIKGYEYRMERPPIAAISE
jgi:hypothetical protein